MGGGDFRDLFDVTTTDFNILKKGAKKCHKSMKS